MSIWNLSVPFNSFHDTQLLCHLCYPYSKQKIFGKKFSKILLTLQLCVACQSDKTVVKFTGSDPELLLSPSRRGLCVHLLGAKEKFCLWNPRILYSEKENAVPNDIYVFYTCQILLACSLQLFFLSFPHIQGMIVSPDFLCQFVFSKIVSFSYSLVSFSQLVLGHAWMLLTHPKWVHFFESYMKAEGKAHTTPTSWPFLFWMREFFNLPPWD